jgi:hypothetical protein
MTRLVLAAALRVVACALFLPLAIPFMVIAPLTLIAAAACWLTLGYDEQAIDRILLSPAVCWADDLPLWLFRVAARC